MVGGVMKKALSAVAALAAVVSHGTLSTDALPVVMPRGNYLYDTGSGARYFVKGITYENTVSKEGYNKFGRNAFQTKIKRLGVNTVRLYNINPDEDYDDFMKDMADMGIYVFVSATPGGDVYFGDYQFCTLQQKGDPLGDQASNKNCYPGCLLEYGKRVIQKFAKFNHTLAAVIGNEIMIDDPRAGICVKQYAADLKAWMFLGQDKMRILPLAYAAVDATPGIVGSSDTEKWSQLRGQLLLCDDTMVSGITKKSIDIFMINTYRGCDQSPPAGTNPFKKIYDMIEDFPIPVLFGEYDCAPKGVDRKWPTAKLMFTAEMIDIWSGGFAYSYGAANQSPDANFAMILGAKPGPDGSQVSGDPGSEETQSFKNLVTVYSSLSVPTGSPAKWTAGDICSWTPTTPTKAGFYFPSCTKILADINALTPNKLVWPIKSREENCEFKGEPCTNDFTKGAQSTQASVCGKVAIKAETGGGQCADDSACSNSGKCVNAKCVCKSGFGGTTCTIKVDTDTTSDGSGGSGSSLKSNSTLIVPIALGVAGFIIIVGAVFCVMFVRHNFKVNRIKKQEDGVIAASAAQRLI